MENALNLCDIACCAYPEFFLWIPEIFGFYVFDLINRVVALLPPFQLLIQEVHHCEVVAPNVVSARQIHIIVRIETGEGNSASEVNFAPFGQWLFSDLVQVALGQAEVDNVNAAGLPTQNKIASLDISVDEASLMDFSDCNEHFHENEDRNSEIVILFETTAGFRQIDRH